MKKNYEEISQKLDKKIEEYRECFKGLNNQEKALVAYKKILELQLSKVDEEIDKEYLLLAIKEASDSSIGYFKALFIYLSAQESLQFYEQFSSLKDRYTKVLKNYKILASELHISSALELSHLFTYMLWNGYYSDTQEHRYNMKNRTLINNFTFLDVIKGSGVCLNYSECLQDYLLTCGKDASILFCSVPKDKSFQRDYKPQIEQKRAKNRRERFNLSILSLLANKILKFDGNHAITLIKDEDKFFAYDPTNLLVLNILNAKTSEVINGKGNFKLYPNLSLCMNANLNSFPLIEELLNKENPQAYNRKEIIFSFENTMETIANNILLLDDAYANIHSDLHYIAIEYDKAKSKRKKK